MCTGKLGHEVEDIKRKGTKLEHKKSVDTTFSIVSERNAFGGKKTNRNVEQIQFVQIQVRGKTR